MTVGRSGIRRFGADREMLYERQLMASTEYLWDCRVLSTGNCARPGVSYSVFYCMQKLTDYDLGMLGRLMINQHSDTGRRVTS